MHDPNPVRLTPATPDLQPPPRHEWMAQAACSGTGHEGFYPSSSNSQAYRAQAEMALRICRRCPVTAECLEYALTTDDRYGVLGGTMPGQRDQMRRNA